MIIFRYLTKEFLKAQIAVFVIIMTIFVSQRFVKVIADASEGEIPGQLVVSIIGLKLPQLAAIILPLSIFLGTLGALGRIYADSEMSVMKACGVSEWYVVRVGLFLSLIMALFSASITLFLSPWAYEKEYQVLEKAEAEAGLTTLMPGQFQKTDNEKAVVFVHDIGNSGKELDGVFLAQLPDLEKGKKHSVIVYAKKGRVVEGESGEQTLVLQDGKQYSGETMKQDFEVIDFGRYEVLIQEQEVERRRRKLRAKSTEALIQAQDLASRAELQWRIALPLSIPLLTLIAIPLSSVSPRQGRFAKLMPALILYIGYFVALISAKSALEDGKIPEEIGLWWTHAVIVIIGSLLIFKDRPLGLKIRSMFVKR
ncbi:LPS export ABC transporter permease LptF [Algicola sagamiensis]|uniref:LPS export ABC transporter permease LptF n=1 Tax=Algicola sagamiensis TaxID=163869 RepID=UPI000374F024|nr:LPS export ABC transporter permease LptF [Algicola sagamiensis]